MSILFETWTTRIRIDADHIWHAMAGQDDLSPNAMQSYDLKMSAQNLRDVADKLDAIRAKHQPLKLVAAE